MLKKKRFLLTIYFDESQIKYFSSTGCENAIYLYICTLKINKNNLLCMQS